MIDYLKDFGFLVCTSAIIIGVFNALVPNKALGKTVRIILGVYMALVIVAPFARGEIDIDTDMLDRVLSSTEQESITAQAYDELILNETEKNIELGVASLLKHNFDAYTDSVSASVNIDEKGSIYCDRLIIVLDKKYMEQQSGISQLIEQNCGAVPVLEFLD